MPDVDFHSASPLFLNFLDWKVALGTVLAATVIAIGLFQWRKGRSRLQGHAKFFARNHLRPGYVEITITNPGPRARQLGRLMLADPQGHAVDATPSRDLRGQPVKALSGASASVVFRVRYGRAGEGLIPPVHHADGEAVKLTTAWFTAAGDSRKPLAIEGIAPALEKLHQDKLQHDIVEARRNGEEGAALLGMPPASGSRRQSSPSRATGAQPGATASPRRRHKKRKYKK